MTQEPTPPQSTPPAAPPATEAWLAAARAIFAENPTLGTPETPTQAGFLTLARAGKEVWNTWRSAYPEPRSDFSETDFTGRAEINFSGFSFGDKARFYGAQFGEGARFEGAQFGDMVRFDGAQFGEEASFEEAKFGEEANFVDAQFGEWARFDGAQFGEEASFEEAKFGKLAMFYGAQFGKWARFEGAQFGDEASFDGAQFGDIASFIGARFGDMAGFDAWDESITRNFWRERGGEESVQRRVSHAGAQGLRSDAFHYISFFGVQFEGEVSFQGRTFLSKTNFGLTSFEGIPNFHGCTLHQNTSFDDADFLAPPSAEAARAYRTLKLAFAQQHAIREEQRFFRLEMQAEAETTKYLKRLLYQLYRHISDYGFSLIRPVGLWFAGLVLATFGYGCLAGASFSVTHIDWSLTFSVMHHSLVNAVPLPGLKPGNLFKDSDVQLALTVLEILHKIVSLVAFFLIGLALRNLFKMKG